MRLCALQHVPFEGPGSIGAWARANGRPAQLCRLYAGEPLPEAGEYDCLIVLGGPMGVYDEKQYPWLVQEKQTIETAILCGKTVLGICLGAQLIAAVLGKRITPNGNREIGWHVLKMTPAAKNTRLFSFLPDQFPAFHWHGDTFEIPGTAIHLASSQACTNQGFLYNHKVVGLQFHLETTFETARGLTEYCANELAAGEFIQPPEEILADRTRFTLINGYMYNLLDRLAAQHERSAAP
ncbi:MAG: type 1 glutamine amidotransferase [Anaerolineales bacterium]|nr:type 1 glutamine amidotransferase [Anaerolineales bacterium]